MFFKSTICCTSPIPKKQKEQIWGTRLLVLTVWSAGRCTPRPVLHSAKGSGCASPYRFRGYATFPYNSLKLHLRHGRQRVDEKDHSSGDWSNRTSNEERCLQDEFRSSERRTCKTPRGKISSDQSFYICMLVFWLSCDNRTMITYSENWRKIENSSVPFRSVSTKPWRERCAKRMLRWQNVTKFDHRYKKGFTRIRDQLRS